MGHSCSSNRYTRTPASTSRSGRGGANVPPKGGNKKVTGGTQRSVSSSNNFQASKGISFEATWKKYNGKRPVKDAAQPAQCAANDSHGGGGGTLWKGDGGGDGFQTASLGDLSLSDLVSQKRDLKAQLKSYDLNFAREHGRMPVKAEKEPIRHLYEQYNALKAHIRMLEAGGAPKSGQQSGNINISHHQPAALGGNILSSNRKQQSQLNAPYFLSSDKSLGSEGSEDSVNRSTSGERRQRNSSIASDVISLGLGADLSVTGLHLPDDIRALKEEKGNLHQMLRNYEKDFFKEHNRQVSSFADIRPVAAQYRRYKEIKRAIATLQAVDR